MRRPVCHELEKQRGLADPRIAAYEHNRASDQPTTQYAVDFRQVAGYTGPGFRLLPGKRDNLGRAGPGRTRGSGDCHGLAKFRDGVPRSAVIAFAEPFGITLATGAADVD
jgi:hypothetical protein